MSTPFWRGRPWNCVHVLYVSHAEAWPSFYFFSPNVLGLRTEVQISRIISRIAIGTTNTLECLRKTFYTTKWAYLFSRYRRLITNPKQIWLDMAKLVIFGKHIMVETNMVDMIFDSCFLLAENFPDALDLAKFPPRGASTRLLASCPFETTLPLAGDTLGYSAARVCTLVPQQHLDGAAATTRSRRTVSYTHLTLPTIYSV